MPNTLGSDALRAFLTPTMSQSDLARELGVTPQAVSQWVRGTAAPDRDNSAALQRIVGIPMDHWSKAPETDTAVPVKSAAKREKKFTGRDNSPTLKPRKKARLRSVGDSTR